MADESYKVSEDFHQTDWLDGLDERGFVMSSCLHLARRFIHSENRYYYFCENHEEEGCPKRDRKGVPDKDCLEEC
jgi:hypothetical protein